MKRALCLLAAALVAVATLIVPAGSTTAAPYPRLDQLALAYWAFPTSEPNRSVEYGASLFRLEDLSTGEVIEYAGFFRAHCKTKKIKNGTMTMCRGVEAERATDYYFDLRMESAWIEGKHSRVEWTPRESVPAVYLMEEWCYSMNPEGEEEEGTGRGAGRWAEAAAAGTIAGQDVTPTSGRHPHAALEMGAAVTECSFFSQDEMADIMSGGPFRYSYFRR